MESNNNNNMEEKERIDIRKEELEVKEDIEDEDDRGTWSGKLDFLLSCLGYAVGLGNVWRFPYLCFKHGGGAFLIPYFIMLAVIGVPCFLMELHLGQYSALGPVSVYAHLSPVFKDCVNRRNESTDLIYINRTCTNDTELMDYISSNYTYWYGHTKDKKLKNGTDIKVDCIYINSTYCDDTPGAIDSITKPFDLPAGRRSTSSDQYLKRSVWQESKGLEPDQMGKPLWGLVLSLLLAWIIIFLCLFKGIKSSGKVVYVTATFPYVVLFILLGRAVTLPGADQGIYFYLYPDPTKLADIKVWEAAATQIFFSLSVAGGGLITLASYNPFHNNILRDTLIVTIGNCLTSFTAGFAIFSVLGFMALELGLNVEDVVKDGPGLAFIAYPDLVTRLPLPTLWAILFFLMLFTLGLDSQFAIVETILTGILDFMPSWRKWKLYIVAGICIVGFLVGLPLTCPGGGYVLNLLDYYAATWPYLFIGFAELMIISYVYGFNQYIEDLVEMTGASWLQKAKPFLGFFYCFLSPLVIIVILCYSWATYEPLTSGEYIYPEWANGIGWFMAMVCISAVPCMMMLTLVNSWIQGDRDTSVQGIKRFLTTNFKPTIQWRSYAIRAHNKDGDKSSYEYIEKGDRLVRRRKAMYKGEVNNGYSVNKVSNGDTFTNL
ncbi:sodium-dependent proline transporter [Eurytemora carolleeae]|uniref:sodium-dependent proline transporter n=1 Tax=Eurytemora carolleeae TaxID=1294199 RepID=UPI000C76BC52|nr:sodium-dependent proline transporter [Eurytemora carolleeae]|eukprot:XP_023341674.1 sodium-dependent proline transporter-like [Eurytemora affinis]